MTRRMSPLELGVAPRFDNPLCAQVDPELFAEHPGQNPAIAKSICAQCDHRVACLEWAIATREPFGVWGGLTAHQRRALLQPGRRLHRPETHPREISDETRARMTARARRLNVTRAPKALREPASG